MIDREQPKRAEKSEVQPSDRRCGSPFGLRAAVGGLPHPAKRRIIGVREPPYGKCRLRTDRGENDEKKPWSKGQKAKSAVLFGSNVLMF